ncbi:MAG TPA: hypothetical protein VF507_01715 [Pyrinomonadaceae bacterium]|jgi:hypothetical protein
MSRPFYSRAASAITGRFSPLQIVVAVSMLVLAGSVCLRYFSQRETSPRIKIADYDRAGAESQPSPRPYTAATLGDDDPAVRYADRLRDASALSISFSLYALNERLVNSRVIPSVGGVLDGMKSSGLVPPGTAVVNQSGVVRSPGGLYYLRYSPNPFGLEVLAVGAGGLADGEVFLIRVPESGPPPATELAPSQLAGGYATLFTAPRADALVPKPFVPASVYAKAGWRQEPLRASPYSPQQAQELKTWLAQYQGARAAR